MLFSGLINFLP